MNKKNTITYLTLDDFKIICHELHNFFEEHKDPLPDYTRSYFDKLESLISIPQRTFDSKDLYDDVYKKAACYFYFVNKLHPFNNGNKRISIVATGVFLLFNELEFTASEDTMYTFAKHITLSSRDQETEFQEVVAFMKQNTQKSS